MFDIEILRGYYKGAGVKVALIDSGVEKKGNDDICNIERYFYDYGDARVKKSESSGIFSDHGSACGRCMLNIAPQITLIDINVENGSLEISEDALCAAVEFAVESGCDIINMSLGFYAYLERLYLICKKAYEKNVIIIAAAAHDAALMFPADFDNYTIKIVDKHISEEGGEEKIIRISNKLYQVHLKPFFEYLYDEELNMIGGTVSMGSSIACVYFTAILALYIESRPFIKKEEIIDSLFGKPETDDIAQSEDLMAEAEIQEKSVFSVISSYYNYAAYKDMINKNIIGYYDLAERKTLYFDDEVIKSDNLYVVNPLNYQRVSISNVNYRNVSYIGDFKDIGCYCGKPFIENKSTSLKNIDTPIFLIAGVGTECGKFNVQLELKKQMNENGLANRCITYNPLGHIFDMDFMKYPDNYPFHDLIYSLNDYIKKIENDAEYESIIIDVAGGMFPLSRLNTNNFGMLYNAYLNALPIDYIIICVNSVIDVSVIKDEIKRLELLGNTDIAVSVSNLSYNEFNMENSSRNIPHIETTERIEHCIKEYKNHLENIPVYSFEDIANGLLYKNIMEKMT